MQEEKKPEVRGHTLCTASFLSVTKTFLRCTKTVMSSYSLAYSLILLPSALRDNPSGRTLNAGHSLSLSLFPCPCSSITVIINCSLTLLRAGTFLPIAFDRCSLQFDETFTFFLAWLWSGLSFGAYPLASLPPDLWYLLLYAHAKTFVILLAIMQPLQITFQLRTTNILTF